eukprot:4609146-Alexandrium_andersonii.AAC.1
MWSLGEGRLARQASWDHELPDWMLRPGPMLTRGLIDGIGRGRNSGRKLRRMLQPEPYKAQDSLTSWP